MSDESILASIASLVEREHHLRGGGEAVDESELAQVETTLDQCWDLLRRRRARRELGESADGAAVRDERTVEGYQQ
ncbi:MAG: DUF2630 family protein [Frankiaceae bacterium]